MTDSTRQASIPNANTDNMLQGIKSQNPAQRGVAVILAGTAMFCAITFPAYALGLSTILCIYAACLVWRWNSWLILLPALLPLLYLTPHSGRIFFDEFDFLLLITIAAGLWHGKLSSPRAFLGRGSCLILALFILCYAVAAHRGFANWEGLDFNALANYYSPLNAFRTGKGLLWALLIFIFWAGNWQANTEQTKRLFAIGIVAGTVGVILVVLWERGVVHDLFFSINRYQLLSSLLDFSTLYRVTGMFADMHTGGTAIDGYVSLVWPFAAYLLLASKNRLLMAFGGLSLMGIFYVMVVTFSRGVYLGIGVSLLAAAFLGYFYHRRAIAAHLVLLTLLSLAALGAIAVFVFRAGGIVALGSNLIAYLMGTAIVLFATKRLPLAPILLLAAAGIGLCTLITSYGVLTSKWTEIPHALGLPLSVASIPLFALGGYFLSRRWQLHLSLRNQVLISLLICALMAGFVPSLFGSRMEQRFATVTEDLLHRVEHWQDAIRSMEIGWGTRAFGQGLGRFPERYFWEIEQAHEVGAFVFLSEGDNTFLRFFGAHDVRLGQRLDLQPNTNYRLALDIRTEDEKALLQVRICHRHLIHPTEWNASCEILKQVEPTTHGEWRHLTHSFNSKNLGSFRNGLLAPLMITVTNRREYAFNLRPQTVLDFDNFSLQTESGREKIKNGDFEKGVDNWFPYYDFNHLPWHIKNIWVHMYFELGMVGLAMFALLILGALIKLVNSPASERGYAMTVLLALVGFLAVGTFGTLIDAPRVAFLFYLLVLSGYLQPTLSAPPGSRS